MTDLKENVDLSIIRYANCWEDPLVLQKGLEIMPGEKILSIASAGDNSFFLLLNNPELIVAADINEVQLFLMELKMAAIRKLEREEYLAFAGFRDSSSRLAIYSLLSGELSSEARRFWEAKKEIIDSGIIYAGKFEKYFQFFSRKILPLIHSKKNIGELFREKPAGAQKEFYRETWNTVRWRLFFKAFFSRPVMGKYGRDPEFLKEVKVRVADFIFNKAALQLSSVSAQHNFILHFTLNGNFGAELPPYVRPENYRKIKANLNRIKLFSGYAQDSAKEYGQFDKMNLSNIFEYMNKPSFEAVANDLMQILSKGGRMAYWNLMVPRRISTFAGGMQYLNGLSEELTTEDNGFFYHTFIAEEKK